MYIIMTTCKHELMLAPHHDYDNISITPCQHICKQLWNCSTCSRTWPGTCSGTPELAPEPCSGTYDQSVKRLGSAVCSLPQKEPQLPSPPDRTGFSLFSSPQRSQRMLPCWTLRKILLRLAASISTGNQTPGLTRFSKSSKAKAAVARPTQSCQNPELRSWP